MEKNGWTSVSIWTSSPRADKSDFSGKDTDQETSRQVEGIAVAESRCDRKKRRVGDGKSC